MLETGGLPTISLEFWEYHGQSAIVCGEPFSRTQITAKNSPFSASFQPSSRDPDFYLKFDQIPTAISLERGAILETDGFSRDPPKIPEKIAGNTSPSGEAPFPNPNHG